MRKPPISKPRPITYIVTEKGCHECTSHAPGKDGYCSISIDNKKYKIHRHIFKQTHGSIPMGLVIRHTCDNKICINPDHLKVGTIAENINDAVERGLVPKGSSKVNSKLTEDDVRYMRSSGISAWHLAKIYPVNKSTIIDILKRKSWKHVI